MNASRRFDCQFHLGDLLTAFTRQKNQPKSAANSRTATATGGRGKRTSHGGQSGRNNRPARKTAEELDSEMVDYWQNGNTTIETNGNAATTANGDANMEDEVLVS